MKLMANTIDLAINNHLWDGHSNTVKNPSPLSSSCSAINAADASRIKEILDFLQPLGLVIVSNSYGSAGNFSEFESGEKRQFARALWLTWAAMIAREEEKTL